VPTLRGGPWQDSRIGDFRSEWLMFGKLAGQQNWLVFWTEAAKVKGGVPWHAGVLQGAS